MPPLLAGTYAGISSVDSNVVDAARAMGMKELQVLFGVEVPNGLLVMFGGIRTAVLQVIATVSVVAYLPLGGLGRYLFDGLVLQDFPRMLAGSLLIAALAIVVDLVLAAAQRLARFARTHRSFQRRPQGRHRSLGRRARGSRCSRRHRMKYSVRTTLTRRGLGGLAAGVGVALALSACSSGNPLSSPSTSSTGGATSGGSLVVGSADFPESQIIAEIYAGVERGRGHRHHQAEHRLA